MVCTPVIWWSESKSAISLTALGSCLWFFHILRTKPSLLHVRKPERVWGSPNLSPIFNSIKFLPSYTLTSIFTDSCTDLGYRHRVLRSVTERCDYSWWVDGFSATSLHSRFCCRLVPALGPPLVYRNSSSDCSLHFQVHLLVSKTGTVINLQIDITKGGYDI